MVDESELRTELSLEDRSADWLELRALETEDNSELRVELLREDCSADWLELRELDR